MILLELAVVHSLAADGPTDRSLAALPTRGPLALPWHDAPTSCVGFQQGNLSAPISVLDGLAGILLLGGTVRKSVKILAADRLVKQAADLLLETTRASLKRQSHIVHPLPKERLLGTAAD